ncbi:MAG: hypothetical protein U1F11_14330 [Steroidobacteraceae bacterium]
MLIAQHSLEHLQLFIEFAERRGVDAVVTRGVEPALRGGQVLGEQRIAHGIDQAAAERACRAAYFRVLWREARRGVDVRERAVVRRIDEQADVHQAPCELRLVARLRGRVVAGSRVARAGVGFVRIALAGGADRRAGGRRRFGRRRGGWRRRNGCRRRAGRGRHRRAAQQPQAGAGRGDQQQDEHRDARGA